MSDYQRWNTRYSTDDYLFGTEPNAFVKAHAHRLSPGARVLAVADGEGRNGIYLAEQGFKVLSIDFSEAAQDKARKLAAARGVSLTIEHVDVLNWDWPEERFDAIVAIFIQFATPDQRAKLFASMKRALKPGGLLMMEGYGPKQLQYDTGGPGILEQLSTRALLNNAFGDWEILELKEYDCEIAEGKRHTGMSALIDLIARKPARI